MLWRRTLYKHPVHHRNYAQYIPLAAYITLPSPRPCQEKFLETWHLSQHWTSLPSLTPSLSSPSPKNNFSPLPPPPLPTAAAAGIRTFDDPVDEGQGGLRREERRRSVCLSKHRLSGPMLSMSRNVLMIVCLCVCVSVRSLLGYRLNVFLPPLPEVGCPKFVKIMNPWGKVMERSCLTFEKLC